MRKLTRLREASHRPSLLCSGKRSLAALLLVLLIQGCAQKPWGDPLGEETEKTILPVFQGMQTRDQSCPPTLEADLAIFLDTPGSTQAAKGFLQLSTPFSFRFVATNPFGQPLFLAGGNKDSFQSINTTEMLYQQGSPESLALRHSLSPELFKALKTAWLTGRIDSSTPDTGIFYKDRDERGIWFSPTVPEGQAGQFFGSSERLLIESSTRRLLGRIVLDSSGKTLASFHYGDFLSFGSCEVPGSIDISGMPYGVEIRMKLSKITTNSERKQYRLPIPQGYQRRLFP